MIGEKLLYKMQINKFLSKFGIEIISTKREAVKFAKEYFKDKKIIVIEIGVWFGRNARDINRNLNVKKMYLIDPYIAYRDGLDDRLDIAKINAHKINDFSNVVWIEEFSDIAVKKINEKIDFLYIDGNHEYKYIKRDLELYWKKIESKGIIAGHDIQYLGVSKAVLEFANKNKLTIYFGDRRDWWIIKV